MLRERGMPWGQAFLDDFGDQLGDPLPRFIFGVGKCPAVSPEPEV